MEKAQCDQVNADYYAAASLMMAKAGTKDDQQSSSFAYDFAMGTVIGALSAGVGIFVIKSCTGKHAGSDNFHRI